MLERYQTQLTKIIDTFTTGEFFREVFEAKREYFENLGTVPEDDPDFENQMDMFMGWFLFDRPLNQHDLPPVLLYYRRNRDKFSGDEEVIFRSLTETKHSVFELLKLKEGDMTLRDLGNKDKYDITENEYRVGFSKGDVFEARLVPQGKIWVFANGFCFHPKDAFKFIAEQMKKIRDEDHAQRTKLMLQLRQMKTKHLRFPHIDVKHIYTLTPKF